MTSSFDKTLSNVLLVCSRFNWYQNTGAQVFWLHRIKTSRRVPYIVLVITQRMTVSAIVAAVNAVVVHASAAAPVVSPEVFTAEASPPVVVPAVATATATTTLPVAVAVAVTVADTKVCPNPYPGSHTFMIYDCKFTVDAKYAPKLPLGRGAYGVVCAAVDRTNNRPVAIKKISDAFDSLIDAKRIVREMKLLRHTLTAHRNVIKLYDIIEPPEHAEFNDIYLVFELMPIDMRRCMQKNQSELTDEHYQCFIYQMLCGLKYIHSANVIHRDIKPGNLLLDADCNLKICDFGLARGIATNEKDASAYELTEYVATRWYRAPEVLCSGHSYDCKLDVWSVGCVLAELVSGGKPLFPGRDTMHQMQLIFELLGTPNEEDMKLVSSAKAVDLLHRLPHCVKVNLSTHSRFAPANINLLAIDLIEKMIEFNPAKRITVNDALKHPYLAGFHRPEMEIECPKPFDFSFEKHKLTRHSLRELVWEEVLSIRPSAADKHVRWQKIDYERRMKAAYASATALIALDI